MFHLNFKKKKTFLSTSFHKILSKKDFLTKMTTNLKITAETKTHHRKKKLKSFPDSLFFGE
jgi:hypothetical protein